MKSNHTLEVLLKMMLKLASCSLKCNKWVAMPLEIDFKDLECLLKTNNNSSSRAERIIIVKSQGPVLLEH
jgi:hypothetical protein